MAGSGPLKSEFPLSAFDSVIDPATETTLAAILAALGGSIDTELNVFASNSAVVSTTDTTILTYTVPAATTAYIQGFHGSSNAAGRFTLKVAGTTVCVSRSSAADRNVDTHFSSGVLSATAGQIVTILFYHEETVNQIAQVNLFGYTKP
jgi:hypothetical protein